MSATSESDSGEEIPLPGGLGSGGLVVRVGDTVRRPNRPFSATVRSYLDHLRAAGFDGAPLPLGIDASGREVLSYLDGDVAVPPVPAWASEEALLVSVAELQRRLHEASRSFVVPTNAVWDRANLPAAPADALVCHNDLCVENVVVRDGRAVAFIDFDFAAPSTPLYDIAIAARHWVPIKAPVDRSAEWRGLDTARRFDLFCSSHRLGPAERRQVVEHLGEFLDRALVSMRQRAEAAQPGYVEIWAAGYPEQNRRSREHLHTLT